MYQIQLAIEDWVRRGQQPNPIKGESGHVMRYGARHRLHLAVFLLSSTCWLTISLAVTVTRFIDRLWLEAANIGIAGLLTVSFALMSVESFSRRIRLDDAELCSSAAFRRVQRIPLNAVTLVESTNVGIKIATQSAYVVCSYNLDGLIALARWIVTLPDEKMTTRAKDWAYEWVEEAER